MSQWRCEACSKTAEMVVHEEIDHVVEEGKVVLSRYRSCECKGRMICENEDA